MARQGGQIQLEQSDMRLALNMAKMAKEGFSCASIEETQQLIKKPCAEVREKTKQGVEFLGHEKVKAAIERHPAMIYTHHTDSCLPCENGTAKNPQTCWRRKGTGAPPPERHLHLEYLLRRQVTPMETKVIKPKVCHPGVCIYNLCIPTLKFLIIMHMPRIASVMKIFFQNG